MIRRHLARIAISSAVVATGLARAQTATQAPHASHAGDPAASMQLRDAIVTAQHGDANKALQSTNAIVIAHPDFAPALKLQGALLEQLGRTSEASAAYAQALKLAPLDAELMAKVGTYRLLAGDLDGAIQLLGRSVKRLPRDGDTFFYLAQAYHLKGDNDLALKAIQESLQLDPGDASVWQKYGELLCSSGDNEAALRWLRKAQHADPALERIDFDLGVASYNNEDLENAAVDAARAAALQPNDLITLTLLAGIDEKLSRWDQATPVYEHILALRAEDAAALLGLAHCRLALRQYKASVDLLEKLLQKDPTQLLAHFYLSRAYAGLGRTEEAQREADLHRKLLDQAGSVVPTSERALQNATVVRARGMLAQGREPAAIDLFRQSTKGPAATPGAPYLLVGVVYLSMERPADAERCLKQAMSVEPKIRGAHTYLGILALQQEDLDTAEREFKTELAAAPTYQLATAELGEVRYRQERWAEAADQISNSKTVAPALLYMLCDAYFHLGRTKEADLTAELVADYAKDDAATLQQVVDLLNRNRQVDLADRLSSRSK